MAQRLKTRVQFQAVMAGGIVARTPHFALHQGSLPGGTAWIGAMVPKRWARRAVTRNAIKRQIYTVSAPKLAGLHAGAEGSGLVAPAFVVRLRAGFDRTRFPSASSTALKQAVRDELVQLLGKVGQP